MKKPTINSQRNSFSKFMVNFGLLVTGSIMALSGLVIQFCYHIGHHGEIGHHRFAFGFNYPDWSNFHKISIVLVSILMIFHIRLHWRWYKMVFTKMRFTNNIQVITLTLIFIVVAITGFVPWVIHLTGNSEAIRKSIIEIHDKIALVLFIYLMLHVQNRFKWFTRFRLFHVSSRQTPFIQLDTRKCEACWKCIELCPNCVFGKVNLLGHKHVRIDDVGSCTGCLKCVIGCETDALTERLEHSSIMDVGVASQIDKSL